MNGTVEIKKMNELADNANIGVANVFVDAYYDMLSDITKDKEKLVEVFKHVFVREVFYVALIDGEIVGMLACSNNKNRALKFDKSILKKSFGFLKGNFIYYFLGSKFHEQLDYDDSTSYIEVVATSSQARGKGVATSLFNHAIEKSGYKKFTLDVIDTNEKAKRIYDRLGFKEHKRIPATYFERKHFNETIHMKFNKPV